MNSSRKDRKQVVVLGGGIAGLAAAHRVTELGAGLEVTLVEAGTRLGGVLETVRERGFLIEHSADNFITDSPWAMDLCRRIGFADELIPTSSDQRGAMVVYRGRLVPVPPGFMLMAPARLWPLVTTPLLGPWGKLRLLGERLVPRRNGADDESLAAFARRRLGRQAYERIVQPLVGGIYAADPERLSLRATLPRFLEMEERHGSLIRAARRRREAVETDSAGGARYGLFVAPRAGMSSMIEAIAATLPPGTIRLQSRARSIARNDDGSWEVRVETSAGAGETLACEGLIVATPAQVAGTLLEPLDKGLAADLQQIEYAGTAIVTLAYRRDDVSSRVTGFGFVVPAVEQRRILAASFSSVKFAGRAPDDALLVRVFLGGALQSELLELADGALCQIAIDELASLIGARGEPLVEDVVRWPGSMPQYHLGHCQRVDRIELATARWPAFGLAGNAYRGVGIPHCIHSGELAAERVVAALQRAGAR